MKKVEITVKDDTTANFWDAVAKAAAEVASWPNWKKAGSGLLDQEGNPIATRGTTLPAPALLSADETV
jgi:hypothetical protein